MFNTKFLMGIFMLAGTVGSTDAAEYVIDQAHSGVTFRVRHMVSKVSGRFEKFEGTFEYEPGNPKVWKASASIESASVNTNMAKRDEHLRSGDFFDSGNCPNIRFQSLKIANVKGNKAKLHGNLTIKCVTKPVVLDLEIGGTAKDPWGNERAGAVATVVVNRKDFGLTWNKALETGGFMVGDDVEVLLEIEGLPKK